MSNQYKNNARIRIYIYILSFLGYLIISLFSYKPIHLSSFIDVQNHHKHNQISWNKAISETEDDLPFGILILGSFIGLNEWKYRKKKDKSA